MVNTTLVIRPGQRQRISPYLKRSIAVLALSSHRLRNEIQLALELNPFVERDEQSELLGTAYILTNGQLSLGDTYPSENSRHFLQDWPKFTTSKLKVSQIADTNCNPSAPIELTDANSVEQTLEQQVRDGLPLHRIEPRSRIILEVMIANLDSRGYLDASFENLRSILPIGLDVRDSEFEEALGQIQISALAGIGARDLRECLLLQLKQLRPDTPQRTTAMKLVTNYLSCLADNNTNKLMQELQISRDALTITIDLIKSLDPEPGKLYSQDSVAFVTPDVIVSRKDQAWLIKLNPYLYPAIQISAEYLTQPQTKQIKGDDFLNQQLQEARWLISSIKQRHNTLLKIAGEIVWCQQEFFQSEQLQPLTQRVLAKTLNLHPSTISRAIFGKYMLTPKGMFEFGAFFSQKINVSSHSNYSASMAKCDVRRMIESEAPEEPLSDQAISEALQEKGIQIARRTVTKYRKQMLIPPSSLRRKNTSKALNIGN